MSLRITGSRLEPTGTMSTKIALEQPGFGPCHHMVEVKANPARPEHREAHAAGEDVDCAKAFAGYTSQVDIPGASVWHALSIAFPDAVVIPAVRPEDDWWASCSATINKFWLGRKSLDLSSPIAAVLKTMDEILALGLLGGTGRQSVIAAYRRNRKVRDTFATDRLLVFTPSEGCKPPCAVLDVPVLTTEFPLGKSRDEFTAHFRAKPAVA